MHFFRLLKYGIMFITSDCEVKGTDVYIKCLRNKSTKSVCYHPFFPSVQMCPSVQCLGVWVRGGGGTGYSCLQFAKKSRDKCIFTILKQLRFIARGKKIALKDLGGRIFHCIVLNKMMLSYIFHKILNKF